ncbi:hypothetical protein N9270_03230, partial [Akkermansiaceae bacterium]|nr:hypothetical protein [Akkermansiaceae bacterium]
FFISVIKVNKFKYFFPLICLSFLFRDIIGRYLPLGAYYFIGFVIIDLFLTLRKCSFRFHNANLAWFNIYVIVLGVTGAFFLNPLVSVIGVINILLFLNYFHLKILVFRDDKIIENSVNITLFIIVIGAYINFFVSPDIFGLLNEHIYSSEENLSKDNFTKRAVSFIRSPQTLGLILAIMVLLRSRRSIEGKLISALVFTAGMLTFSKSFFVTLLGFFIYQYKKLSLVAIPVALVGIGFIDVNKLPSSFQRILNFKNILAGFDSSKRMESYSEFFTFENLTIILFGNGVGTLSRGAEILAEKSDKFYSSESFFLQLYSEIGITGLGLFLLLIWKMIGKTRKRGVFSIILLVSAFTPSLYGFGAAFFFYYFLFKNYSYEKARV